MKVFFKLFIILIFSTMPGVSHAFPELPFCPAGGPPGWLNHFNYKRDQNIQRHYAKYRLPAYNQRGYYQPRYNDTPVYRGYYTRPDYYFSPPQNGWPKGIPAQPTFYRNNQGRSN